MYEIPISPAVTTGYKQDFENAANGWITSGVKNSWERGIPQSGPNAAASGKNVFATNLTGPYQSSANMNLLMPPVSVPKIKNFISHTNIGTILKRTSITVSFTYSLKGKMNGSRLLSTAAERQNGKTDRSICRNTGTDD